MNGVKKKELRAAYKEFKPKMGVFCVTCPQTGETFLGAAKNIPAAFNRAQFQLNMGSHPNKHLQSEWKRLGEEAFAFEAVQRLEYSGSQDDYAEDLEALLDLCLAENPEAKRLVPGRAVR